MIRNPFRVLEKALGYRFRNKAYLEAALTHRSYRFETHEVDTDNQRLEFLGDAALGLVAAAYFYETHPELQEGPLTKLRSRVTSRQALARVAKLIDLGEHVRFGRGERQSGGHLRPSNMADAMEAVLGAAFLDGQLRAVERIFHKIFPPLIEPLEPGSWSDNPKGALQELCQREWKTSPKYHLVQEVGPAHDKLFTVDVTLNGQALGQGSGSNKRAAEMSAAREALEKLEADS